MLLGAYGQGWFPMAEEDGRLYWYDPDPRAIIPLAQFHISRSLARNLRRGRFDVRYSSAFRQVMMMCAEPAPGRETTWISAELIEAYGRLHDLGFAHSVETWLGDELVGGVYGVSIAGLFAGESMFSRRTDASKVALASLVARLNERGYRLFDIQFMTAHLKRFGAVEISRAEYRRRLADALTCDATFI